MKDEFRVMGDHVLGVLEKNGQNVQKGPQSV